MEFDIGTLANQLTPLFVNVAVLFFVLGGILIMLNLRGPASLLFCAGVACVALVALGPNVIESAFRWIAGLPLWLMISIGALVAIRLTGSFISVFIGRRAADAMMGNLAADLVRVVVLIMVAPIRLLRRFFGGPGN